MNPVGELLTVEDIRLDLDASSKDQVLDAIASLLASRHGLSKPFIMESLTAREQLGSTGMGHGVAIPHARTNRCSTPAGVLIRTRTPVPFDAPDGRPVSVFLGLIVPDKATECHLQILGTAASMFSDRSFRQALKTATDAGAISELVAAWPGAQAAPA